MSITPSSNANKPSTAQAESAMSPLAGVITNIRSSTEDITSVSSASPIVMVSLPEAIGNIFTLVENRMALMKDVAICKYKLNKPIEDLPQEARIINCSTAAATKYNLAPEGIKALTSQLICAAKKFQEKYWKCIDQQPDILMKPHLDLLLDIRPRLQDISDKLCYQLSQLQQTNHRIEEKHLGFFKERLALYVDAEEANSLFAALKDVKSAEA